jgi:hypothetical protein
VPKTQTRTFDVTEYRTVAEEKTITETVMVPYTEQRDIEVRVCKMVAKTVMVPEDECYDDHGHARRGLFGWRRGY